jgi:hypothetical protein
MRGASIRRRGNNWKMESRIFFCDNWIKFLWHRHFYEDNLKVVANAEGGDDVKGFIEVNVGGCYKKSIEPVDSKIFEPKWLFVSKDRKKP